jgi:O-antigen ligase
MKLDQSAGLSSLFWRYCHGDDARASHRWMIAIFLMFVLFPGVGSGGSVMFGGIWLVALSYWIFDPGSRRLTSDETKLVLVFAAYFLIMAGFAILHAVNLGWPSGFGAVYSNLPFLLVAPVLPVLRRAARSEWTPAVFAGLACGALLAAVIVAISGPLFPHIARKALSGNALVLALGVLISGLLCIHGTLFFRGRIRWLTAAGALASLYVLLVSGGRGPLLSYCVTVALYAVIMGLRHFGLRWMFSRVLVMAVLLFAVAAIMLKADPELAERYDLAIERLSNPTDGKSTDESVLTRLVLYEAGLKAFLERPLTGHGRPNVLPVVQSYNNGAPDKFFNYSHLHNGYLTDLVASGIPGLLSLLAVLFVPLFIFWNARPVVFGGILAVVIAYIFYGATNLLFYHDVVTLLFLSLMCVFNALAVVETDAGQGG